VQIHPPFSLVKAFPLGGRNVLIAGSFFFPPGRKPAFFFASIGSEHRVDDSPFSFPPDFFRPWDGCPFAAVASSSLNGDRFMIMGSVSARSIVSPFSLAKRNLLLGKKSPLSVEEVTDLPPPGTESLSYYLHHSVPGHMGGSLDTSVSFFLPFFVRAASREQGNSFSLEPGEGEALLDLEGRSFFRRLCEDI